MAAVAISIPVPITLAKVTCFFSISVATRGIGTIHPPARLPKEGLNKRAEAWIWAWLVTHWRLSGVMGGGDAALRFRRGCRPDCGHITPAGSPIAGGAP